jgi:hypothetical protein
MKRKRVKPAKRTTRAERLMMEAMRRELRLVIAKEKTQRSKPNVR